jgi:hypothetical protein
LTWKHSCRMDVLVMGLVLVARFAFDAGLKLAMLLLVCSVGKKVNKKVLTMFEHAEAEYKALEEKKNIVEVR